MINFAEHKILKQTKLFEGTHLIHSIDAAGDSCYSVRGNRISKADYEGLLEAKKNKSNKPFTSTRLVTQPLILIGIKQVGDEFVIEAGDVVARTFEHPSVVDVDLYPVLDMKRLHKGCTVRLSLEYITYNVTGADSVLVHLRSIQLL